MTQEETSAREALIKGLMPTQWFALCTMIGTDMPQTEEDKRETLNQIALTVVNYHR